MLCPNARCACDNLDGAVYCCRCGRKLAVKKGRRSHANGVGTAYRRGRTWTASVTVGWHGIDGHPAPVKHTKGGFSTKKEALAHCPSLFSGKEKKKERFTVKAQYEAWTATKKYDALSASKKTAYKIAYERLKPIEDMDIGNVRLEDIQPIIDSVSTYYPARDIKQVLSHLFKPAIIDDRAQKNYAEYLDMPQKSAPEKDAFSVLEIERLWALYNDCSFVGYILIMIYTGMAFGELKNVRRSNIDFEKRMIYNVGTKNDLRKRTPIFLCDAALTPLHVLYELSDGKDRLLTIGEDLFYAQYYEALKEAGCRRLTPHCCRHTTATALAYADVHPAVIKTIMRHSKYQTTTEYTHIDAAAMVAALNKIPTTDNAPTTNG